MYIQQIQIHGFGALQNRLITFQPDGINVVIGPNESGKSTLCQTIPSIIYGRSAAVGGMESWSGDGECYGSILLRLGQRKIQIQRNFLTHVTQVIEYSGENAQTLFTGKANPRGKTDEANRYRSVLSELGIPPEAVLRSSGYIGQMDVQVSLDDELRKMITGPGQGDYLRAKGQLSNRYYELTRSALPGDTNKQKDKKFEQLTNEVSKQTRELELAEEAGQAVAQKRCSYTEILDKLENSQNESREIERKREALEAYLKSVQQRQDLLVKEEFIVSRAGQVQSLNAELSRLCEKLSFPSYQSIASLSASGQEKLKKYLYSEVEATLEQIKRSRQELDRLHGELSDPRYLAYAKVPSNTQQILANLTDQTQRINHLKQQEPRFSPTGPIGKTLWRLPVGAALFSVVCGFALFMFFQPFPENLIPGWLAAFLGGSFLGLMVGGFTALFFLLLGSREKTAFNQRYAQWKMQITFEENRYQEIRQPLNLLFQQIGENISFDLVNERWGDYQRIQEASKHLENQIAALENIPGIPLEKDPEIQPILQTGPSAVLKERFEEVNQIRETIRTTEESIRQMSVGLSENQDLSPRGINRDLRDNLRSLESIEQSNPEFASYRENPEAGNTELGRMTSQYRVSEANRKDLADQERAAAIDLRTRENLLRRDPLEIREELQQLEQELDRVCKHKDAYALAYQVLQETISEYETNYIETLSTQTTDYFNRFTGGRYAKVEIRVGKEPLVTTHTGHVIQPGSLSQGARDQLYLALRLTILDLLSEGVNIPVIFDDTFVNFDQTRLETAHQAVMALDGNHQVILLSHNPAYREWGENIQNIEYQDK